jgi:hypothetical protein
MIHCLPVWTGKLSHAKVQCEPILTGCPSYYQAAENSRSPFVILQITQTPNSLQKLLLTNSEECHPQSGLPRLWALVSQLVTMHSPQTIFVKDC